MQNPTNQQSNSLKRLLKDPTHPDRTGEKILDEFRSNYGETVVIPSWRTIYYRLLQLLSYKRKNYVSFVWRNADPAQLDSLSNSLAIIVEHMQKGSKRDEWVDDIGNTSFIYMLFENLIYKIFLLFLTPFSYTLRNFKKFFHVFPR